MSFCAAAMTSIRCLRVVGGAVGRRLAQFELLPGDGVRQSLDRILPHARRLPPPSAASASLAALRGLQRLLRCGHLLRQFRELRCASSTSLAELLDACDVFAREPDLFRRRRPIRGLRGKPSQES